MLHIIVVIYLPDIGKIKKRMDKLDIKPYRLAAVSGVDYVTVLTIVNGKNKNPSYETVKKLFDTLSDLEYKSNRNPRRTAGEIVNSKKIKNLITVSSTNTLSFANDLFNHHEEISQFPVFKEGLPVGLITEKTIRKQMDRDPHGWMKKKVTDVMEPAPPRVEYDTPVHIVVNHFDEHQCVLVRDLKGRIIGILDDWDLRRHYSNQP